MLLLPVGFMAPAPGAAGGRLLDGIPTVAALSFRKLVSAYAGPCLRVRRPSDNAEMDVGFVAGKLNTASMLASCGSGSGFVSKWYDQSGGGHDGYQTAAANQPVAVNSGSVAMQGGAPAVDGTGAGAQWLNFPAGTFSGLASSTAICTFAGSGSAGWWTIGNDPNTITPYGDGNAYEQYLATSRPAFPGYGTAYGALRVHTAQNSGTTLSVFKNGAQVGTAQATTFTAAPTYLGSASSYNEVVLSEVVLTAAVLSTADRQAVERSMGGYYGIAVA